jgi:hypothetical protein
VLHWNPVLGTNGTENALKDSASVFKLGFGFRGKTSRNSLAGDMNAAASGATI